MKLSPVIRQLHIVDRFTGRERKLDDIVNNEQVEYMDWIDGCLEDKKPIRGIVLKARQIGISTITEGAIFSLAWLTDNFRGLIIAHENDASEHILSMNATFKEHFKFAQLLTERYSSKRELGWRENNSLIRVATAKNAGAGRSRTLRAIHASEVAFWEDPENLMLGMRQSLPYAPLTLLVLESTANGIGNYFYRQWSMAQAGEIDVKPIFFSWLRHANYTAERIGLSTTLLGLDEDERILKKLGANDGQLVWRRWAIRELCENDKDKFRQEYPAVPEEAFLATGENVFHKDHLDICYQPEDGKRGRLVREGNELRFQSDPFGPLTVFKPPSSDRGWGIYFVGGDPTHTTRGDFAVAQVINRRSLEQVAVLRLKCDPVTFGRELQNLGYYYNEAMISTEIEGPGYGTIGCIMADNYPHVWQHKWADRIPGKLSETHGWSTTVKRKEWAIGFLVKLIVDHDIIIHDRTTYTELLDYVRLDIGFGPASTGGHDDTVMSLAITYICHGTEAPLEPYSGNRSIKEAVNESLEPSWQSWGEDAG